LIIEEVSAGSQYSATGGVMPYTWSISCGSIDSSGTVTSIEGCCGTGTVAVKDYIGAVASSPITFSLPVTLDGPATPSVGSQYSTTTGKAPFTWSISCGSIDSTGMVTSLEGCCDGGTVTVTDGCESTGSLAFTIPPPSLLVSGPAAPAVGSQYSASGGNLPLSWSISCGTISSSGQVTSLAGCCGSGTVTASDACGHSKSAVVRFPSGQWVEPSINIVGNQNTDHNCNLCSNLNVNFSMPPSTYWGVSHQHYRKSLLWFLPRGSIWDLWL
jgi:hypothetical protein